MLTEIELLPGGRMPLLATDGSFGYDLFVSENFAPRTLYSGAESVLIPMGFKLATPVNVAPLLLPRSGSAHKQGLRVANAPGLIDEDYRGEILVAAYLADGYRPVEIKPGDRIAQMVFVPVVRPMLIQVGVLSKTARDAGGFGSTGDR